MLSRLLLSLLLLGVAPAHAAQCGTASFYGTPDDGYAWQTMASGKPMNPAAMITAHPSLPMGTRLVVTNPANGRTVRVVVLDRGPWTGGRVLDLSPAAFSRLAPLSKGLARVCFSRL